MRLTVFALAACSSLAGCIPFIGGGYSMPKLPEGYSAQVLTQQPRQSVAACLGALTGTAVAPGSDGTFVIASAPTFYLVDTIRDHGVSQNRVLIRNSDANAEQVQRAIKCAAGIPLS